MKKLIKRKLFYQGGSYKNFFLWEISNARGLVYEIIEEFKGKSIARAMLRGIYKDRLSALNQFRKVTSLENAMLKMSSASRLSFMS